MEKAPVVSVEHGPSDTERWLWLVGLPLVAALALWTALPWRPDWTGHFLAGFGATLGFVYLVAVFASGRAIAILVATLACVAMGHGTESTLFRLAGFDDVDFATQSVGAVLAGLALLFGHAGDPEHDPFDRESLRPSPFGVTVLAVGIVALVIGCFRAFA